ncbi:MAG: BON domain-containing protein [Proteobacteria bacterium]|nr:BON domain-containing protein [Pseudomonadota bacterium]
MKNGYSILLIVAACLLLEACAAAIVAGAGTGAVIAHDRRTFGTVIDDQNIELKMRRYTMQRKQLRDNTHVNFTSVNGIVLLSGEVQTDEQRKELLTAARAVAGVRRTVNQMNIAPLSSLGSRSHDVWLTGKVKARLAGDRRVDSTRIKVVSEASSVYLMGLVTRQEGADAADAARVVSGAKRIVKLFDYID